MMRQNSISQDTLVRQLRTLGVQPGGVLLVHTAFSQVGPVAEGPAGLIAALRTALTPAGTLVMPSMSWDDDHPFDPQTTPCPEMGIVADSFWRLPGVLRSASPHAFAASGPHAGQITADHRFDIPHGLASPVGRVFELDGQVLLLGVGHDANTTIHLAENLAGVRYRRDKHVTLLVDDRPARFEYREIDHCCENFALVDRWLDDAGLQQRGTVGHGTAGLLRARDVVRVVVERLYANETTFLHPRGVDEECDDAWRSLPAELNAISRS
jgi:aminoglycoside N3'-acetyltransferase